MNKNKRRLIFTSIIAIIISLVVAVGLYANTIDPNNPGDSPPSAWTFENTMNITEFSIA